MISDTDKATLDEQLVQAIYANRVAKFCSSFQLDGRGAQDETARQTVEKAAETCVNISRETAAKQMSLLDALNASGVTASAVPLVTEQSGLQFHQFQIRLTDMRLDRVLEVVASQGYIVDPHLFKNWKAVQAASHSLYLMADDQHSTRVRLYCRASLPTPLNKLEPGLSDFAFAPLPAALWPLYFAVKPVRFFAERLTGQRTADRYGLKSGSFSLGTPPALLDGLFDLADISQDDTLVDLGCGDGRIVVEAAKRFGCKAIGIERNPALVEQAHKKIAAENLGALAKVHQGSAMDFDISDATVVFLFLPRELVQKMSTSIFERARAGTRVIAHEQDALNVERSANKTVPIFADIALTVGHLWTVK